MTTWKSLTRRTRCALSRFLWRWTQPLRRAPAPVSALDPLILQAVKSHKPRRHYEAERTRLAHEALRRGIGE
jgi:hypothetical protein